MFHKIIRYNIKSHYKDVKCEIKYHIKENILKKIFLMGLLLTSSLVANECKTYLQAVLQQADNIEAFMNKGYKKSFIQTRIDDFEELKSISYKKCGKSYIINNNLAKPMDNLSNKYKSLGYKI